MERFDGELFDRRTAERGPLRRGTSIVTGSNPVQDLSGNSIQPGTLGTFRVAIPQSFLVTNANDSGSGSLRDALTLANSSTADDAITFDPTFFSAPRTIALATALPTLSATGGALSIAGPGTANLKVDGGGNVRVLDSNAPTLNLSGFTVTGGLAKTLTTDLTNEFGGGFRAGGLVTL